MDGNCHISDYKFTHKIYIQDYEATVRLNNNRVILRSGVTCELGATRCIDVERGDTY